MAMKKLGMFTVGVALLGIFSAPLHAADIVGLEVVETGAKGDGTTYIPAITLTRTAASQACGTWAAGEKRYFYFVDGMEDAGLATLLTALSLGKTVTARFVDANCALASTISLIKLEK